MSRLGTIARNTLFPALELAVGRRNVVRLARALTMAARLDVANDMRSNGETLVQEVILRHASHHVVIFDVGANVGEWSQSLMALAGTKDWELHAFEPASATFARLRQNLEDAGPNVHLVQQALSAAPGTGQLHIVGEGLGVNSLHVRPDGKRSETITLNTVDAYCAQGNIQRVNLIKIDAEGHDLMVLEGARRMLEAKAIDAVQFEYNARWIDSRHYLKDAFELLHPLGYDLGKVTPKGIEFYPAYHCELESFREGNYLACLPAVKARFPQVKWWNLE